jgi:hypothetical protein
LRASQKSRGRSFAALPKAEDAAKLLQILRDLDRGMDRPLGYYSGPAQRRSAIAALNAIMDFLDSQRSPSHVLHELRRALALVERGEKPDLFRPVRTAGRPPETEIAERVKGICAGMVYAKMRSGASRDEAIKWVARNLPAYFKPPLIKNATIRQSTIKEWMSRYGCTLRVRQEIRLTTTSDESDRLKKLFATIEKFNAGQQFCLLSIYAGEQCLAKKKQLSYDRISEFFMYGTVQ